jgi:hypothetical protein
MRKSISCSVQRMKRRQRAQRSSTIILVASALSVAGGCVTAPQGEPRKDSDTRLDVVAPPRLAQLPPESSGNDRVRLDALFLGSLVIVDNCVLIENELGKASERLLPVWPSTFKTRSIGRITEVLDHRGLVIARTGEPFMMGGGQEPGSGTSAWFKSIRHGPDCLPVAAQSDVWAVGDVYSLEEQKNGPWSNQLESLRRTGSLPPITAAR